MEKHVYHQGDRIRILRTRIIARVGYGLHPSMFAEKAHEIVSTREAQQALGLTKWHTSQRVIVKLAQALAFAMVADKGFGGNERSLHYKPVVPRGQLHDIDSVYPLEGAVVTVDSKYVAYTGTRFASWSGQNHEGEWDCEPGGLENRQTHVILRTMYGDIETCDVEPALTP